MSDGLNREVCTPLEPELEPASPSRASSRWGTLSGGSVDRRGCVGRCNDVVSCGLALALPLKPVPAAEFTFGSKAVLAGKTDVREAPDGTICGGSGAPVGCKAGAPSEVCAATRLALTVNLCSDDGLGTDSPLRRGTEPISVLLPLPLPVSFECRARPSDDMYGFVAGGKRRMSIDRDSR